METTAPTGSQIINLPVVAQIADSDLKSNFKLRIPADTKVADLSWRQQAAETIAKAYSVPKEKVEIELLFKQKKLPSDLTLADWSRSGSQYIIAVNIKGLTEAKISIEKERSADLQQKADALRSKLVDAGKMLSKAQIRKTLNSIKNLLAKLEQPKSELQLLEDVVDWLQQALPLFNLPEEITKETEKMMESLRSKLEVTELKLKVAELDHKDKENEKSLQHFRQKSRRNFWQKYLFVVLQELKVEDIERASLGELYGKLTKEMYTAWRKSAKDKKLPSYTQMANLVPTVIKQGNSAVHEYNMMELFEELCMTGDNVEFYEPMWNFIVEKCETDWQKWSVLIAMKDEKSQ